MTTIYKHIVYNPHQASIQQIIQQAQGRGNLEGSPEWQFVRSQPVTEYEWVAIFEKWEDEFGEVPTGEKICERNCPDFNGMDILHNGQCVCSCHKELKMN